VREPKQTASISIPEEVIRQRNWTERELRARGYEYYARKKEVTMARSVPDFEAPKQITITQGDQLVVLAGYMICYDAGDEVKATLDDYLQWPVAPEIFASAYKSWDEPDWQPTPAEEHLMQLGCKPYYKFTGVWAQQLEDDTYLQSLEHAEPVKVQRRQYIAIGIQGEPYSMGEVTFHTRYIRSGNKLLRWLQRLLQRLQRATARFPALRHFRPQGSLRDRAPG
jgi:hypothetical protein